MRKITLLVQLITCCLLLMGIAVNKNHRLFGHVLDRPEQEGHVDTIESVGSSDEWVTADGHRVVTTENIAKDITGFAGPIPLNIYLKDNRIDSIEVLENEETPGYMATVIDGGLLNSWDGMTPSQVLTAHVDGVTGATYSSNAIIGSVNRAMEYVNRQDTVATISATVSSQTGATVDSRVSVSFWCSLIVVLVAMILPLFWRNRIYRVVQLVANVVVLGFWCHAFMSLSLLTGFVSNGVDVLVSLVPLLMIIAAFVYPFFNKREYYCSWICPFGSMQELIGRCVPYRVKMPARLIQVLTYFREILWIAIMVVMWLGVGFEIMNYELFTAFLLNQASTVIIVAAVVFALLSAIIPRPYCRFVCPTGSLVKFYQDTK